MWLATQSLPKYALQKSFYKIKPLTNNYWLITYLNLLIITTNNSSYRYKRKMPRINFVKHTCCCSPPPLLRLQWLLKNMKSEVLLLSKRGSQSRFYRTWRSISLRHQLSTLWRKSCGWFLSGKTTRSNWKLQLCYQIKPTKYFVKEITRLVSKI